MRPNQPPPPSLAEAARLELRRRQAKGQAAPGYERIKTRARDRNARLSRAGRDIAPLPPVQDPERKARCARDAEAFLTTYFRHLFPLPWSPSHREMIRKAQAAVLEGSLYALGMPRGSGKTTILEAICLWAAMYGHCPFVVLLGPDAGHAERMLDSIKTELETNALLAADFPEIVIPILRLEGIANRCAGQHLNGRRTFITWTAGEIVLPTVAGSAAAGAVIRSAGLTASIRGMKHKRADGTTIRPSLVFLDDIQTDRSADSATQCATRERILVGAVLGLAGPGRKIAGLLAATVLRAGDVADRFLDPDIHPEWNGTRVAALIREPAAKERWDEYAEIRAAGLRAGTGLAAATDFYRRHRAEMDAGAEVYWPERFNADEISAVQNLMNLRIQDPQAFEAEQQNRPAAAAKVEDLTAAAIAAKTNGLARGLVPIDAAHVVGFIDVQRTLLYWCVAAVSQDMTGAILDYGAWPEQARPYYALREARPTLQDLSPGAALEGAIFAGLARLLDALAGKEWPREGGGSLRLSRLLVDANWGQSTDTVFAACRQSAHAAVCLPSHGRFFGASSTPIDAWARKTGETIGPGFRIGIQAGRRAIRAVTWDTNHWKTLAAARLRAARGDRGTWTLFGTGPEPHRMIADHLTSESPIETTARGRTVEEWKMKPGRENHWWDCVVGCVVAAAIQGASLIRQEPARIISLAERRKNARRWAPNNRRPADRSERSPPFPYPDPPPNP